MTLRFGHIASVALAITLAGCDNLGPEINGEPVTIDWAACGFGDVPLWFAAQDGNGAWSRVAPQGAATFSFTLLSGRGGVALFDSQGLFVIYGTSAELQSIAPSCSGDVRDVSSTVTGYTSSDNVTLDMGSARRSVPGSTASPASFTMADVEPGDVDLIAVKAHNVFAPGIQQKVPTAVFVRRGISGSTTPAVDLNSATEAAVPTSHTVTVSNATNGEQLQITAYLVTPTTDAQISSYFTTLQAVSGDVSIPFYTMPPGVLPGTDNHELNVSTLQQSASNVNETRFVNVIFAAGADQAVTLGPLLGPVTVSGSSRPSAQYTIQSGYDRIWNFFVEQSSSALNIYKTSAYEGRSTGSVTLAMPDLSGVSGFDPSWLPVQGNTAGWGFLASDASALAVAGKAVSYKGAQRQSIFVP